MAGRWQAGHAPLTQYAKGLQRQRRSFGDAGEQAPGAGLILDQLLQGLMGGQMLRPDHTAGQDDQVERLRQQIDQHPSAVSRVPRAQVSMRRPSMLAATTSTSARRSTSIRVALADHRCPRQG